MAGEITPQQMERPPATRLATLFLQLISNLLVQSKGAGTVGAGSDIMDVVSEQGQEKNVEVVIPATDMHLRETSTDRAVVHRNLSTGYYFGICAEYTYKEHGEDLLPNPPCKGSICFLVYTKC